MAEENRKNTVRGNTDEKEKSWQLTEAEQKRLEKFEAQAEELVARGYTRTELTVGIKKANAFALWLLVPLFVIGLGAFWLVHKKLLTGSHSSNLLVTLLVFAALIVVHELIHGVSWAIFAPHHWKDIEFGFMKQYLTPYCACCAPLAKGPYIFGSIMPLILLGILPMAAGILSGSLRLLLLGILMTDSAAGDILIIRNILRFKTNASDVVYMDHPTQAGGVIFTKD